MLCLVLPLLSALAPTQADALPQTAVSGWDTANGQRMGYLPVLGAPPLRFESPPPRPEPKAMTRSQHQRAASSRSITISAISVRFRLDIAVPPRPAAL